MQPFMGVTQRVACRRGRVCKQPLQERSGLQGSRQRLRVLVQTRLEGTAV